MVASLSFFSAKFSLASLETRRAFRRSTSCRRDRVAGLRALEAAGGFVQLLLRNQLALEHFLRAGVFSVGVEEIGSGALDRGKFFRIGRRRIIRANAKLCAHLGDEATLAIDFILQLLGIDENERLAFLHVVADIGKNLRDAAFDLRA